MGMSERPSVLGREGNGPRPVRQDSSSSYTHMDENQPADKLRFLYSSHLIGSIFFTKLMFLLLMCSNAAY